MCVLSFYKDDTPPYLLTFGDIAKVFNDNLRIKEDVLEF